MAAVKVHRAKVPCAVQVLQQAYQQYNRGSEERYHGTAAPSLGGMRLHVIICKAASEQAANDDEIQDYHYDGGRVNPFPVIAHRMWVRYHTSALFNLGNPLRVTFHNRLDMSVLVYNCVHSRLRLRSRHNFKPGDMTFNVDLIQGQVHDRPGWP